MITIYTDGSSRGNPGPGGYGAIIFYDGKTTEIGGRDDHTTNNRMELTATIKALEFLTSYSLPHTSIQINTDSEYVIKGMTTWIHNWQAKGWRTAGRKAVLNQDLWQRLIELAEGKSIEWKYVPGHTGVKLNERADVIATSFADNLNPPLYNGPRESYK